MKQVTVVVIVAAAAAGYFFRDHLAPYAPKWAQPYLTTATAKKAAPAAGGRGHGGPVAVSVVAAKAGTLPVTFGTIGSIVADDTTVLAPQIAGTIARVMVPNGADVKAGDLIVKLDDSTIMAQVAKDQAQIEKDQATLANAQATYERTKNLVDKGISTAQAGGDALTAVKVAQGALAVDQATLAADRVQLSHTEIRAPFDGRLGVVQFSTGAYVGVGTQIVRITRMAPVTVQFSLPDTHLPLLRKTKAAGTLTASVSAVLSEGGGGATVTAPVTFIDNAVDAGSATVTMRAALANEGQTFWPGQPVNVTVTAGDAGNLVLVPNVAVMPTPKGAAVYLAKADGTAALRDVTVALRVGNMAGISAGLQAGDKVIVEGQADVTPGAKIRIVAPKAAPAVKQGQASLGAVVPAVTKS